MTERSRTHSAPPPDARPAFTGAVPAGRFASLAVFAELAVAVFVFTAIVFTALFVAGLASPPAAAQDTAAAKDVSFPDPPPKMPSDADVIEYFSTPASRNRYLLDLGSLSLGEQDSVRFSILIESSSGVRNVRHEAIRCGTLDRRILAIARADGSWSPTPNSPWQPVGRGDTNLGYHDLQKALCFGGPQAKRDVVSRRIETGLRQQNF